MTVFTSEPSADSPIRSTFPTTNLPTLPTDNLDVGEQTGSVDVGRSLLKWDLSSLSGITITSAVLSIRDRTTDLTDNARTMRAYRVLRAWVESQVTYNVYSTGNNWGTAGCGNTTTDREATDIGSVSMPNPPLAQFYTITLTTAKVQEWIDGTLANNGLILKMDTESDDCHRFDSRRLATANQRPFITIKYNPINTVAPAVTGTATVGQTLSCTTGTWTDGTPTFTYQWQRDANGDSVYSNIGSATASTYALVDADDNCKVRCIVTDTDEDGFTTANSNATAQVVEPVPTNSVVPAVSGTATVGQTLTSTTGTWTHQGGTIATYAYKWQDSADGSTGWADIALATSSTYVIGALEVGLFLRSSVIATNTGGASSAAVSLATSAVALAATPNYQPGTRFGFR